MFSPSDRRRHRTRLWCEHCKREWFSSIYLSGSGHECPLCHRRLAEREAAGSEEEGGLPSFWDVRLHSHDQIGRRPPRPSEVRVVFETLELLLDGLLSSDLTSTEELAKRAAWADFVLRRAFAGLGEEPRPAVEQRGPEEALRRGGRIWTALDQADSGREAALAIAGLPPDDLRAALLAAVLEHVESRRPGDAGKWVEALASFTEWWRPQDLL